MASPLSLIKHYGVAYVTLENPDGRGNVLNQELITSLHTCVQECEKDHNIQAIVLRGKGGVFCKGLDFKWIIDRRKKIKDELTRPYVDLILSIYNNKKPVVADIDGLVSAGGLGICAACDAVVATENSVFQLTETFFGIIPAYVIPILLTRMTSAKVNFMAMSSTPLNGVTAKEVGLVDLVEIVSSNKPNKELNQLLQRINFSSGQALSELKLYVDRMSESKLEEKLVNAGKKLTELLNREGVIDNIEKFMAGEKLSWSTSFKKLKPNLII